MNFTDDDDDDDIIDTSVVSDDDSAPRKKAAFLGTKAIMLLSGLPLAIGIIILFVFVSPSNISKSFKAKGDSNSVHGLLEMQSVANEQITTFWKNFLDGSTMAEKSIQPMMDKKLIASMSAFGDAICSTQNGLCGLPRTLQSFSDSFRTSLQSQSISYSCETASNRLQFSFVCPHTGETHYKIVKKFGEEHTMSATCEFTPADMVKASYIPPVKAVAKMRMNSNYNWVVKDIVLIIEDRIYTLDKNGVSTSTIPKKVASTL